MASSLFGEREPFIVASIQEKMWRSLNAQRKLCDLTFIVEGRTFKAHRAVMAACSDYFCAMLTGPMREANEHEIILNGVSARGFELLLEFVCTSLLGLRIHSIEDLLSASSYLQMRAVTECCARFLETQIDLENCADIATGADLYALDEMPQSALDTAASLFKLDQQQNKTANYIKIMQTEAQSRKSLSSSELTPPIPNIHARGMELGVGIFNDTYGNIHNGSIHYYLPRLRRWEVLTAIPSGGWFNKFATLDNRWDYFSENIREVLEKQRSCAVIGGKLYVSAGSEGKFLVFDTKALSWTNLKSMLRPRLEHVVLPIDGKLDACDYETISQFWANFFELWPKRALTSIIFSNLKFGTLLLGSKGTFLANWR